MTSEEFDSKYRLLKQIAGGRWRTFTAEQRSSGRAALTHFVDQVAFGGEASLLTLIEQLNPRDRSKVLETLTVGGSLVCVTEVLDGFDSFENWLRSRSAPSPEPAPPPAPAPAPPAGLGEFTKLFRGHSQGLPPSPRPSSAPLQASSGSDFPRAPEPAKPQSAEPASAGFTELFRAPPAPLPTPQPAPRPVSPPPGLDSVLPPPRLDSMLPPPRLDSVSPPPRQDPLAPPPLRVVGLRFGSQVEGPLRPPKPNFGGTVEPPPAAPVPLEPRLPQELFPLDPGPTPIPAAPQPIWSGPSEFTRQLERSPAISAVVPAAVPAAEPEPPPDKKSYVPLLLALNLIVIIATGLIVYFALRRR
jgi:hypothetical protein